MANFYLGHVGILGGGGGKHYVLWFHDRLTQIIEELWVEKLICINL